MFKRLVLATTAFAMLAAPIAHAQPRFDGPRHHHAQPAKPGYHAPKQHHVKKHAPKNYKWSRGQRVPDWKRRAHLRDWHRHGLRKPGYGQHWIKVGNEYLLISLATGLILGMAAAR